MERGVERAWAALAAKGDHVRVAQRLRLQRSQARSLGPSERREPGQEGDDDDGAEEEIQTHAQHVQGEAVGRGMAAFVARGHHPLRL